MSQERLALSVSEAAEIIGIRRDLMYRLVMSGDVESFRVGSRRLVSVQRLREYVERRAAEADGAAAGVSRE